jgi:site-specific DNA-cytosine methylase
LRDAERLAQHGFLSLETRNLHGLGLRRCASDALDRASSSVSATSAILVLVMGSPPSAGEAARIQGFPDWFDFVSCDDAPARRDLGKWIGNAVPTILGYAAGISALANPDAVVTVGQAD